MQGNKLNIFLWLLIFIGLQSANQWSEFPIGNTYTEWIASTIILLLGNYISKKQNIQYGKKNYLPVVLFLCWAVFGAIRGAYVAENYWEYKNLVYGVFASFLCLYIRKPSRRGKILQALDQSLSTIVFCVFLLGNNSRGSKLLSCSNFCTWLFYAYDAQRVALCYSCSVGIYACGRY